MKKYNFNHWRRRRGHIKVRKGTWAGWRETGISHKKRRQSKKFWAIVKAKSKRKKPGIKVHKYDGRYHNKGHFDLLTYLRANGR